MVAALTELAPQPRTAAVPLIVIIQDLSLCLSFDLEVFVEDGSLLVVATYRPYTGAPCPCAAEPTAAACSTWSGLPREPGSSWATTFIIRNPVDLERGGPSGLVGSPQAFWVAWTPSAAALSFNGAGVRCRGATVARP